jgi:ABC-type transport system involved in multi-copper enzyme maturation permease subunit
VRALFWKDYRLNLLILVLGLGLLLGPYLAGLLWHGYDQGLTLPEATACARLLYMLSYVSLGLSQLTLVLLGGNAVAAERADRSAEFLAYLPPSRGMILGSKALLAGSAAVLIWGLNLLIGEGVAPALSSEPLNVWELPSRWPTLAGGLLLFGAGWLGSTLLESPTFATSLGIVSPFVVAGVLAVSGMVLAWPAPGEFKDCYCATCLILGPLCFGAGTCYYLRRVEP